MKTVNLLPFKRFERKRISPYEAFYAWCKRHVHSITDVTDITMSETDEEILSEMEYAWLRKKHRRSSAKWMREAFAMHHLCYSPSSHACVNPGMVLIKEPDDK